ncbi:MAG: LysR family transcriptional regulator [Acidobacteriota bacterium]|nr:LysR family transcriptional regulator [Acidobacteriota bacterium]
MDLHELQVFQAVASEQSFSRAATRLHRTQPAVSQAIRRLEDELGERLFDRSSKGGRLTEAGTVLLDYAERMTRLKDEATSAVRELQQLRRGRVVIGVNEAAVHVLLPIVVDFREAHPRAQVEMRRVHSRQIPGEVLNRSLDFGLVTYAPGERGLNSVALGVDELVMLTHPNHPLARQRQVTMSEFGRQTIIAHNDPSPRRELVLRRFEQKHAPINIEMSLPSLDGIKRAVEMNLGVALLPRRCALSEIARKQLAAVRVPQLRAPRTLRLIYRRTGETSHAADAFLAATHALTVEGHAEESPRRPRRNGQNPRM